MKLSTIRYDDILKAGEFIDFNGIADTKSFKNLYWIELPNGRKYPFKYLIRIAYQFGEGKKGEWLNFQSKPEYRAYIKELGFNIIYFKEQFSFFEPLELQRFQTIAGTQYRTADNEAVRQSALIKPLVRKLNLWAKLSCIEDFHAQTDNHWQWSGNFKSYLWIRIRREQSNPLVYFILGCGGEGQLFMKIDCQRSNYAKGSTKPLSKEIIHAFDEYINDVPSYREQSIDSLELENYSWDKLIERTQQYLQDHANLYDELEQLISGNIPEKENTVFRELTETPIPNKTKSYANRERSFKGNRTNWVKKHKATTKLGNEGEQLVIIYEKQKLEEAGLHDLSDQVEKMLDGKGFDIRSFDLDENEIHIEVKTTKGKMDEPFYMSSNEKAYFEQNQEKYVLYRLYEFNYHTKSAQFYKIDSKLLQSLVFEPINFEVSFKNK